MTVQHLLLFLLGLETLAATGVAGLHCNECVDVDILESEREANSTVGSLYDKVIEVNFYREYHPATCDAPSVVKCSENQTTCLSFDTLLVGEYYGIAGKAEVRVFRCLDLSEHGRERLQQTGCQTNAEAWDLDSWSRYVDFKYSGLLPGAVCTCDDNACNDPSQHDGLYCHTCLDVTILETERTVNSVVPPLRQTYIDMIYGGVAPAACDKPDLLKCSNNEICFVGETIMAGTYSGIRGMASLKMANCQDLSQAGFSMIQQEGCQANWQSWDLNEWKDYLNLTFTDKPPGIECTCDEIGCNEPRGFDVKQCSSCKDIRADLGDVALNHQVEAAILLDVFDMNMPWCPYAGDVECETGGLCITITVTIYAQYNGKSGLVNVTQHMCMSALDVINHGTYLTTDCVSVTSALLNQVYGDAITRPFSSVDKVEGMLCTCNTDMCNLPERPSVKPNQNSSTKSQMTFTALILVFCILYM